MTSDDLLPARSVILAGFEGRCMALGGLVMRHDQLDSNVLRLMTHHDSTPYWLLDDPAERARLAAALIAGYVATHPTASAAERLYDRKLRQRRALRAGARRLRNAAWSALQYLRSLEDTNKALPHASDEFAHPVQNPVENHIGVIPLAAVGSSFGRAEHLRSHIDRGDVMCRCNSDRVHP